MEIPEPRVRETGILMVEQLRAFERRLHTFISENTKLLTERIRTVDDHSELRYTTALETTERVARESAERGVDLVVRLHALGQQFQERLLGLGMQADTQDARQTTALQHVHDELMRQMLLNRAEMEMRFALDSDRRQDELLDLIQQFRREVDDRTAKGRWRRVKLWCQRTWQTMRGARHGR